MIRELVALIEELKALVVTRFHGTLTVHFAAGVPKKIKTELVRDL